MERFAGVPAFETLRRQKRRVSELRISRAENVVQALRHAVSYDATVGAQHYSRAVAHTLEARFKARRSLQAQIADTTRSRIREFRLQMMGTRNRDPDLSAAFTRNIGWYTEPTLLVQIQAAINSPALPCVEASVRDHRLRIIDNRSLDRRHVAGDSSPMVERMANPNSGIVMQWYNQSYTRNNENCDLDPR
jgi:hypothetical protein